MADVVHYSYEHVHQTLADVARRMCADGLVFDCMVAIGSGGYIPSRILKTYLGCPIFSVTVAHYSDSIQGKAFREPKVIQWLSGDEKALRGKKALLVDEVDDTRSTLAFCAKRLLDGDGLASLSIAVLHNKMKEKSAELPAGIPYYAGDEIEDHWVVYPWEAVDISDHIQKCRN